MRMPMKMIMIVVSRHKKSRYRKVKRGLIHQKIPSCNDVAIQLFVKGDSYRNYSRFQKLKMLLFFLFLIYKVFAFWTIPINSFSIALSISAELEASFNIFSQLVFFV